MRKSKSYRFKPATLDKLGSLRGFNPDLSETEIVETAIDLLVDVYSFSAAVSSEIFSCRKVPDFWWKAPGGIIVRFNIVK